MRLPPRTIGLGALVADVSAAYNTADSYTGGLVSSTTQSSIQQLVASFPPDVQQAISTGQQVARNGQPALDLVSKIAGGGVPSVQETCVAFAGLVSMINPYAGALVLIGGEAIQGALDGLKSLFNALGFYPPVPPTYGYTGLHRCVVGGDCSNPIPLPPDYNGNLDPNWIYFDDPLKFKNFVWGHNYYRAPNGTIWPPYSADATSDVANRNMIDLYWHCLLRSKPMDPGVYAAKWSYSCGNSPSPDIWRGTDTHGSLYCPASTDGSDPANTCTKAARVPYIIELNDSPSPFEIFANQMMVKNLEYWANGLPFLPPRLLLAYAQIAWNKRHQNDKVDLTGFSQLFGLGKDWPEYANAIPIKVDPAKNTITYHPAPSQGDNTFYFDGAVPVKPNHSMIPESNGADPSCFLGSWPFGGSTISALLGPWGGVIDTRTRIASDSEPLTINAGSLISSPAPVATKSAAVTAAVAVPATAALGTVIYAYATGQAVDVVLKGVWRGVKRLFR